MFSERTRIYGPITLKHRYAGGPLDPPIVALKGFGPPPHNILSSEKWENVVAMTPIVRFLGSRVDLGRTGALLP